MNTLLVPIFTDSTSEYVNLQSSSSSIDFTDVPCVGTRTTGICGTIASSLNFLVTAPLAATDYYEIQFMLANNFWGCDFNFGNSACGIQIRQGIAHMLDKTSFTVNQLTCAGVCTAIDNPVPTTTDVSITSPNPCGYDVSFPQSGSNCVVGAPGGTSYHLAASTGADGYSWLYAPGSADLNAAAQHFVNAGLATGFNSATSILTGISSAAASNSVRFFIRSDDAARRNLGESLEAQICYLFTGSYTFPCPYLDILSGPVTAFPGFTTSPTTVNRSWWMYTAAYNFVPFFDDSLYLYYNSLFVSASCTSPGTSSCATQQIGGGPCSNASVPTASAEDYMYLCSPTYDSLSFQMENASSISAATSHGLDAEAYFGANVFTLPIFERTVQFGYLNNGWNNGVINNDDVGLPNYFTWLNAYNPTAPLAWTIRQGFSQPTRTVSPFIASTDQESYILGNIYDSLSRPNPLSSTELLNFMTTSTALLTNSSLTYTAPPHTLATYRFFLRPDAFFQDGRPVTAYDVAFSYLSMVGSGAFLGSGAWPLTGITILNPHQFDIGVRSLGPFTLPNLTGIPILPGRYWTVAGSSAWDSAIASCTSIRCPFAQYALNGATVICPSAMGQPGCTGPNPSPTIMQVDPAKVSPTYDPIASHTFVGSGPWQCGTVTSSSSGMCSSSGTQNPPVGGGYTLTRFGNGLAPASSTAGIYFRSNGDLALYIWSQENDVIPIQAASAVDLCFGLPVGPGSCSHWQQGIGASPTGVVGINQVSIVFLRYNTNWVAPFEWTTSSPLGIGAFPPILYEGSVTLSPASVVGCPTGYDC